MFPDKPSEAQIKRAIMRIPVILAQEQKARRSTADHERVWPPDFSIFVNDVFYDHTSNREQFMLKLADTVEALEHQFGKKPFIITSRS